MTQAAVSQLERRTDVYLSTLENSNARACPGSAAPAIAPPVPVTSSCASAGTGATVWASPENAIALPIESNAPSRILGTVYEIRKRRTSAYKPNRATRNDCNKLFSMWKTLSVPALAVLFLMTANPQTKSPFIGRWDFNVTVPGGVGANLLGVSENAGGLEVWFQPTGGHVVRVQNVSVDGKHMSMTLSPATDKAPALVWNLDAGAGKLTGTQKRGERTVALTGVRAPDLKRSEPKAWTNPEPLFNGKNLAGWEPIGDAANSHWLVQDGLLVNEAHGANLKTVRKFEDFRLHFEVNCPDRANSGFYLRGRYEVQLENEQEGTEPPERSMGSVYGRLAPHPLEKRRPGEWETFDITLVGRAVSVTRNGVLTIDHQEIEGITGGALDANEGEPGVFYIQGDHTGGLKFRNIMVSVPN